MPRWLPPLLIATAASLGCTHRIDVVLQPMPAVALEVSRVAVVSGSRECRDIADALVGELNDTPGITVDPRADVQLEVIECAQPLMPVQVDVEIANGDDRRRLSVEGSAHALLVVRRDGHSEAHLIGATRRNARGAWGDHDAMALSRAVDRELTSGVAADLAEQLRPVPKLVERRVYANPVPGTPQETFNLAVLAEASGDLHEARRLATASRDARPTARSEAYVAQLDAMIARIPSE